MPGFMNLRNFPAWLGIACVVLVVALLATRTSTAILGPTSWIHSHLMQLQVQRCLRAAFLLISIGLLCRPRIILPAGWRWTVRVAVTMLAFGVAGEVIIGMAANGWIPDPLARLGTGDSLGNRLFRLGSMAVFAVPMLALLAAGEQAASRRPAEYSGGVAALLLRWEPVLFAVGAVALGSILIASAFVHREILWLSPIGSDATIAACAAAAIRARQRAGGMAFSGWIMLCASMAVGLLMGGYSFGGPLPTPAFIGEYGALPRIILRDSHVILICLGIACVGIAGMRKPVEGAA